MHTGIDVERDVVGCMGFRPIVRHVDPRLFRAEPIGLKDLMLDLNLTQRLAYDADRNILFLNLEGLHVRRREDIVAIKDSRSALLRNRPADSAFKRVKLRRTLTRTVRPHIFESSAEAQSFHNNASADSLFG